MDIRLDKDALAVDDAMTMIRARPLDRAKAISGLINEEALASERLGRLTDKAAAAMPTPTCSRSVSPSQRAGSAAPASSCSKRPKKSRAPMAPLAGAC